MGMRISARVGTLGLQNANAVAITGGTIAGITDLAVADGGTGASDAATARTNLGLGSIATQNANAVAITGGTITGITDLAVADGGTGTSTGSITGTTALVFTAGGSNQNVQLVPSGSGYTLLGGNVGIGTTGPGSALSVNGGISAGTYSATAAPSGGMIISGNVGIGTTNPTLGVLQVAGLDSATAISVSNTSEAKRFALNGLASGGWTMYDAGSGSFIAGLSQYQGNVGIGTTGPSAKLAVNGGCNVGADTDPGDNNLYVVGDCSALTFTDRTKFFKGDALEAIMAIKEFNDELDHESLCDFMRSSYVDHLTGEIRVGRNLGNTVSVLVVAVQELVRRGCDGGRGVKYEKYIN